jgi:anti-anti-sigma factor
LDVKVSHSSPWTTVHLSGELDMESTPHLTGAVEGQLELGRSRITVDLSSLTFCDSRGLAAILDAAARCQNAGGSLLLSGAAGTVARVLEITGVDELLADGWPLGSADAPPNQNRHAG